jgi:Cellulase (glycosyl hydrolase family 5)
MQEGKRGTEERGRRSLPAALRRGLIGVGSLLAVALVLVGVLAIVSGSSNVRGRKSAVEGAERFDRAASSCSLTAGAGHAGGVSPPLLFGLSASIRFFQGSARCEETRLAAQTGVQAVREDISWAETEPEPNRYDWTNYDAVVRTATEAGLMVLPIIDDSPAWAAPTRGCLPSGTGPYASFVAAVVSRYGPGGTFWRENPRLPSRPLTWYELWNEPWTSTCNRDPAVYARLVVAATNAGRAASHAARFLIAGETFYHTLSGAREDWISGMYAAVPDLGKHFDALSVHPYGGDPTVFSPGGDTDGQPGRLQLAYAELVAHGDADKPLWVTEIGWSTCAGASDCVTQSQQASYLHEFLRLATTTWRSYVRAVFVYDLRDIAPNPPDNDQAWFGLLRPDLSKKPAWWVLHDAATGWR